MKLKPWLSYSFDPPDPELPEFQPNLAEFVSDFEPCFIWWRPSIFCDDLSLKRGIFYEDQPFSDVNFVEVHVESIRAFHLLCRHNCFQEWGGIVRILPPVPELSQPIDKPIPVVCFGYDRDELLIGTHLVSVFGGCVADVRSASLSLLALARIAVFPVKRENTSCLLCAAISERCGIVSSDAGAAEEYLSAQAKPGSWHVLHRHRQGDYVEAVRELIGEGSRINRPMYVDEVPYE